MLCSAHTHSGFVAVLHIMVAPVYFAVCVELSFAFYYLCVYLVPEMYIGFVFVFCIQTVTQSLFGAGSSYGEVIWEFVWLIACS